MKRPRIALWIRQQGLWGPYLWRNKSPVWWCPNWLWRWAVRRVGKWHAGYAISPFSGRMFQPEDPIDWPDDA